MTPNLDRLDPESELIFHASPYQGGVVPFAVLGFCWIEGRIILALIKERGWCVPSGRIEVGETPLQAVAREAKEEGGIQQAEWHPFGWFEVNEEHRCRVSVCYVGLDPDWDRTPTGDDVLETGSFELDGLDSIYYDWSAMVERAIRSSLEVASRLR